MPKLPRLPKLTTSRDYYPPGTPLSKFEQELFKQSPAMAVSSRILQGMADNSRGWPEHNQPSLADVFIASTFNGADFLRGPTKKRVQQALMQYRIDMHKARRFVLDDDFVEMATHLATANPAKILARIQYATLPYDTTWIEFNLHKKVRTIRAIHGSKDTDYSSITPRLGMLLQRINDTDTLCTLVSEVREGLMPHVSCYFFSTKETDFSLKGNDWFGCRPTIVHTDAASAAVKVSWTDKLNRPNDVDRETFERFMASDSMGKATLWGYTSDGGSPMVADDTGLTTPRFLHRHGDVGQSRMYRAYNDVFPTDEAKAELGQLLISEMREFTGQIRWLVTVLAMLNEVPVSTTMIERKGQMRAGTFRKHNFLDYHKVTLRLPKKNPVQHFERYLRGQASRRRAHEVRSHWRTYMNEAHCHWEQHDWTYDNEDGYRLCGKCMAYSRLIHEHVRGDPELGWVRKDYLIKKDQD